MKKNPDFISVLVGPSPGFLAGYIVVAFVCALVIVFFDISRRNVTSVRTPEQLSIRFWLADNLFRVVANFLFIPILIRVFYEYPSAPWMLMISCGIGFGVDYLGMIAKNAGLLTTNKISQAMKEKIEKV
jgi:hypothetical protein